MNLSREAVIEYLANLDELEEERLWQKAQWRRSYDKALGEFVTLRAHCCGTKHPLQCLRCHEDKLEKAVRDAKKSSGALERDKLRNILVDFGDIFHRYSLREQSSLSLLDVAVIVGNAKLAAMLRSLAVPQVFIFELEDFVSCFSGLLHATGSQMIEAAWQAGIDVSALQQTRRCPWWDGIQPSLLEIAIASRQKGAATRLSRSGVARSFNGKNGGLLFRMTHDFNHGDNRHSNSVRLFIDARSIEIAVDLGIDLRNIRVDPRGAFSCARFALHSKKRKRFLALFGDVITANFAEQTLLDMAIHCGQIGVAKRLTALCCDTSIRTRSDLHACLLQENTSIPGGMHLPADLHIVEEEARRLETARAVYRMARCRYQMVILQMSGWWDRELVGTVSTIVHVKHEDIIDLIAKFALAIPDFLELRPVHTVPRAQHVAVESRRNLPRSDAAQVTPRIDVGLSSTPSPREDTPPYTASRDMDVSVARDEVNQSSAEGLAQSSVDQPMQKTPSEVDTFLLAMQKSKAETPPLSSDGVALFKLTRKSHFPSVDTILLDPHGPLKLLHNRVLEAGCEVCPSWSPCKAFFVPLTEPQMIELAELGFELTDIHIVAMACDRDSIQASLKPLRKKHRPGIAALVPLQNAAQERRDGPHHDDASDDEEETEPMLIMEQAVDTDSSIGYPVWTTSSSS